MFSKKATQKNNGFLIILIRGIFSLLSCCYMALKGFRKNNMAGRVI